MHPQKIVLVGPNLTNTADNWKRYNVRLSAHPNSTHSWFYVSHVMRRVAPPSWKQIPTKLDSLAHTKYVIIERYLDLLTVTVQPLCIWICLVQWCGQSINCTKLEFSECVDGVMSSLWVPFRKNLLIRFIDNPLSLKLASIMTTVKLMMCRHC